jgi:hypothetical protein
MVNICSVAVTHLFSAQLLRFKPQMFKCAHFRAPFQNWTLTYCKCLLALPEIPCSCLRMKKAAQSSKFGLGAWTDAPGSESKNGGRQFWTSRVACAICRCQFWSLTAVLNHWVSWSGAHFAGSFSEHCTKRVRQSHILTWRLKLPPKIQLGVASG